MVGVKQGVPQGGVGSLHFISTSTRETYQNCLRCEFGYYHSHVITATSTRKFKSVLTIDRQTERWEVFNPSFKLTIFCDRARNLLLVSCTFWDNESFIRGSAHATPVSHFEVRRQSSQSATKFFFL